MSTNTQAMNSINKVQTPNTGNKTLVEKKNPELQFEALFSSAMGQIAPNAQLNSIESQLRESLFKQENIRKHTDTNPNAEAAQAAQSTLWAQRNWMQQASSAPAQESAGSMSVNKASASSSSEQTVETTSASENRSSQANEAEQTAESRAENRPAQADSDSNAADKTPDGQTEQTVQSPQDNSAQHLANAGSSAADVRTAQQLEQSRLNAATELAAKDLAATAAREVPQATGTNTVQGSEPGAGTKDISNGSPTVRLQDTNTGNPAIDKLLGGSSTSARTDTNVNSAASLAANSSAVAQNGSATAVAAQLAPQIAQQVQSAEQGLELEELKTGQKILAASTLPGSTNPNAVAGATNGLGSTTGTSPQALIKTPVNQPGFAKELGQTVQWAIGKNLSTVDIRVNPESFGPMNMRLVQKGQQVQLVIRTQDEASANLLTQSLGSLKEVLAQTGIQLNQVQIQHGNTTAGQGQNSQNQAQFEQNSGQQGRGGQQPGQGGNAGGDTVATTAPAPSKKAAGQLDMFA